MPRLAAGRRLKVDCGSVPRDVPNVGLRQTLKNSKCVSGGAPPRQRTRLMSIERELLIDHAQFRGPDEPRVGDGHGMQKTLEVADPKIQELPELGKVRMQVMLLPNVILQNPGMVGQAVEDVGGREAVPFKLAAEVDADHEASPEAEHWECCHSQRTLATGSFQKMKRYQNVGSMPRRVLIFPSSSH